MSALLAQEYDRPAVLTACVDCGKPSKYRRGIESVTRYPDNMDHQHLDALLRRHPHLVGTRTAAMAEALRDWAVSA